MDGVASERRESDGSGVALRVILAAIVLLLLLCAAHMETADLMAGLVHG